jgi:signal transduction histidine kinase/ActR/RegA family two-component response regulator
MKMIESPEAGPLGSQHHHPSRGWSRFSPPTIKIRYRLPLLIGILLAGVILAATWASYAEIRASALGVGRERLANLTAQFANLSQQQAVTLTNKTLTAADEPSIRDYVNAPSSAGRAAATAVLQQFLAPLDPQSMQVELWSSKGSLLLILPAGTQPASVDLTPEFKKCSAAPFKTVGAIRQIKDTLAYPAVAAVRNEAGSPVGYIVRYRKLSTNPEARKQLTELLGSQATLFFGNLQEDVWTDLAKLVTKPTGGFASTLNVTQYTRDGNSVMALGRPITGTPWFIVIEFSQEADMAPATRLLRRVIMIDVVLLLFGIAAAFVMSGNITKPLQSFTEAASAISAGDYSRKVNVVTQDELGALGVAFNTMMTQVTESQRELERKVQERTTELEEANRQLELLSQSNWLKRTQAEKERSEAVNALRNTEEQLQQAQKLEAVGRLAGGISHDFNNMLTAIIGYSDLTLNRLPEGDPLKHNLTEIRKAGERAASLTGQLLAFSRKQVMQPKVIDLNVVVSELEKMLRRMIGEDIELKTSLQHGLGNVKADPGQIEQVIMNLAVNARDAMPTGGKLTIETGNVYLDESYARQHLSVAPGAYVMLAVSDSGIGMDAETQSHMFDPFFTTKEAGKGTGLGLSMVYGIVKQSGGNIWVYSETGKGTTFKIYLPRVTADTEKYTHATPELDIAAGSETILLVEDADVVRDLAREVLEEISGYRVLEATNAEDALQICQKHQGGIDLLLTDVVMPGGSGPEVSARVRALKPDIRVLYMSGYTDDAIVRHGVLEAGLNFIQKPFTPNGLAQKVREVLDSAPLELTRG